MARLCASAIAVSLLLAATSGRAQDDGGDDPAEGKPANAPPAAGEGEPPEVDEGEPPEAGEPEPPAGGEPEAVAPPAAEGGEGAPDGEDATDEAEDANRLVAPPPDPTPRVAVLLLAARGAEPETADALTEVAIGAVAARGGATILGKEELQTQLGQGEARSMECVTSTACLGRVGVELGVDEVVAGTVGRRGETWVFNLNRIDIHSGELVGRAFREVEGDLGAVAAAIQEMVPGLYEVEEREPATLLVSANVQRAEITIDGVLVGIYRGEPVRLDDVSPGRHRVAVSAPGHADWARAVNVGEGSTLEIEATLEGLTAEPHRSPLLWVGTGLAVVAGVTGLAFGVKSQDEPGDGLTRVEAMRFVDDRERDARIAHVSFGVAAVGAATLVLGLLLSDFSGAESPPAHVGAAPLDGGALLRVEGSL